MAIIAPLKVNTDRFFFLNRTPVFIRDSLEAEHEISDHVRRTNINFFDRSQFNFLF